MKNLTAILHCDKNWGIGKNNTLMYKLPKDMSFFRKTTLNKTVVMGSNTLLSFPGGMPLKSRRNIVLWPDGDSERAIRDGFEIVRTINELLKKINDSSDEVYVIGGAMMYRTLLPYCNKALITFVDDIGNADTFFPDLSSTDGWECIRRSMPENDNGLMITFTKWENKKPLSY